MDFIGPSVRPKGSDLSVHIAGERASRVVRWLRDPAR